MRKKFIAAVLCALLTVVFAFAACTPGSSDENEYTLEREPGTKQVTIYYNRAEGYSDCDIWFWYSGADGKGYVLHPCEYGAKMIVNVPESVTEVNYIIRTGVSEPGTSSWTGAVKDGTDSDRKIKLTGDYTVIYTKSKDANNYISSDGGKTLEIIRFISLADMQDATHVKIALNDGSAVSKDNVSIKDGEGNSVGISSVSGNVITTAKALDLSTAYTLNVAGISDGAAIVPLTYFNSKAFANEYTYDGELGVILADDSTTFRLWAPTASEVKLNLYAAGNGGEATKSVVLQKKDKGVWEHVENTNLNGTYYTYTVKTSAGVNEVVDPYARSAGLNGLRGMILDLDATDPSGWTEENFVSETENYTDAQIWEVHIRDFSNKIETSKYKGKYLAFTETGLKNANGISVGLDYVKQLGITHVHLLPSFDYASVDESKTGKDAQFNWGYDPQNYNVPEGSYSTDPADGAVRVNEYKRMVQALHAQGIGVVMDVVYNHTYSADSNLQKIVPYYYYRFNTDGTNSNGSGCGNETASERSMVRKFIVDSVKYWQDEYHLDGFRFDLMAVHDVTTIQEVEKAVHAKDSKALIYGEGWTGGSTTLDEKDQAALKNLAALNKGTSTGGMNGVAMFNDVIRDGVKGSVFEIEDTGFATGAKASYLDKVLFGVTGGYNNVDLIDKDNFESSWYTDNPTQVINYVSAHDNNTLWDRICHVYGEEQSTLAKRTAMNRLSAAIVQTSLGIPFMQAGEEMLRQKKNPDGTYNENSYNSSDEVNNLDWSLLKNDSVQYQTMQYYKGLIAFRKSCAALRFNYAINLGTYEYSCELLKREGAFAAFTIKDLVSGEKVLVVYNAEENAKEYSLPSGNWDLYVNGTQAGATAIESNLSGKQSIDGISCYVYKTHA